MFVVDDVLLTYLVLPYGARLLDHGRDRLYDWLDSELGKGGRKLAKRIAKRELGDAEALKELGHYVEEHHGAADKLAAAALSAELEAARALPVGQGDEEFLRVVRDYFLTPVVEMVQALGRPVILPGFVTGTDWLTAIDVRTVPPGEKLEQLNIYSQAGKNPARINLWLGQGPVGRQYWLPRIWLVTAADEKLAATLRELAADPHTTPQRFAQALEHQPFVTGITRGDVIVGHARMPLDFTPVTTGKTRLIPWAGSPAGIKTLRAELAKQLGDQQRQVAIWIRALKELGAGQAV